MPADLDEFRDELARRIEALLDQPPGAGDRAPAAGGGRCCGSSVTSPPSRIAHQSCRPSPAMAARLGAPGSCSAGAAPARRAAAPNSCARWCTATRLMPIRAHGAIALVGETEHDVREVMIEGPAGMLRTSPRSERPHWTAHAPAAGMGERRGGLCLLGRGPRAAARAAVRRRLVRRARQVDLCRGDLRHAAVRPAPGRAAARSSSPPRRGRSRSSSGWSPIRARR